MKNTSRMIAGLLTVVMAIGIIPSQTIAAKKPKLSASSIKVLVGSKKTLKLKNGNNKAKVAWKINKPGIAKIVAKSTKGKSAYVTVKGIKKGNAKIMATYKLSGKSLKLSCKVIVKNKETNATTAPEITNNTQSTMSTSTPTNAPIITQIPAAVQTPHVDRTAEPVITAEPAQATESAKPSDPTEEPVQVKSIKPYLEDTNYDVPDNYDRIDNSVAGTISTITYPSTVIKNDGVVNRNAKVALPKDYDENKKYPVIYMNHGIFGNENSLSGDNVQNVLWNAIAEGVAEEAILVFPNCCANEAGAGDGFSVEHYSAYNNFLNDLKNCLMPYINEHYSTYTDRNHTAVCGFSMGGRVTLHVGFTLQDMFRYAGAFCPAPGIFDFSDMGVSDKGLFTPDTFTLKDEYMNDTLVMIVKGTTDTVVHKFPGEYHDALVKNNVPHIFYEKEGGHEAKVYKHGFYNFVRRIFHL